MVVRKPLSASKPKQEYTQADQTVLESTSDVWQDESYESDCFLLQKKNNICSKIQKKASNQRNRLLQCTN